MNKTARILAILMAVSLVTPTYPFNIENRTWHALTGLGAIGGGILGTLFYQKFIARDEMPEPNLKESDQKKPKAQKKSKLETFKGMLPVIGSAALGALLSALALRRMLWSSSATGRQALAQARHMQEQARLAREEANRVVQEQARLAREEANRVALEQARVIRVQHNLAQAQHQIVAAQNQDRLNIFIMEGIDERPIGEQAAAHFDRYPLVYAAQNMQNAEQRLAGAAALFGEVLHEANGDQQVIDACNNGINQANQLIEVARDRARRIRMLPDYGAQVEREGQERAAIQRAQAEERRARAAEQAVQAAHQKALQDQQLANQRLHLEQQRIFNERQRAQQAAYSAQVQAQADLQKAAAEREHARATEHLAAATQQNAYAAQERAQAEMRTARAAEHMAALAQQQQYSAQQQRPTFVQQPLVVNRTAKPKKSSSHKHHSHHSHNASKKKQ